MRINRELGGDFDLGAFDHLALWNAGHSRIEMHLVSRKDQIVNAAGHAFAFSSGERLHTENSHKFTLDMIARLAAETGWSVSNTWISDSPEVALFCGVGFSCGSCGRGLRAVADDCRRSWDTVAQPLFQGH
jgi:uncharacterized SAM-dependent methyltransferase